MNRLSSSGKGAVMLRAFRSCRSPLTTRGHRYIGNAEVKDVEEGLSPWHSVVPDK